MKSRSVLFILLFLAVSFSSYPQSQGRGAWGDSEAAGQYVKWAERAIAENRWSEALTVLERAGDFANVSSDISWLLALARAHEGRSRSSVLEALDSAIEMNRWVHYNASAALLLKAGQFIGMYNYSGALAILDQTGESADSAVLRLLALKALADNDGLIIAPASAAARFRSLMLTAMDRYPRDPRPLRIFFEYARNRRPEYSRMAGSDLDLLEFALRRLPFLLEADPDLAWIAAPFVRDTGAARRLVASYRASSSRPGPGSIAAALNLGLIEDSAAVEELFEAADLDKDLVVEIGNLLRSEEGRDLFTQRLLSFSGTIFFNEDNGGYLPLSLTFANNNQPPYRGNALPFRYAEGRAFYRDGILKEAVFDTNRAGNEDLHVFFSADGVPDSAQYPVSGEQALIQWERYPSVQMVTLAQDVFLFRPADFQFASVEFVELGGSKSRAGLAYPVPAYFNMELTRRSLFSFCSSIRRPSVEFPAAVEQIFFQQGIPLRAVETMDGKQVSITEFERGLPVVQYLDFDLDGRMETVRRFRPPEADFELTFNYRDLIVSSESDWTGEGVYKTGEVYLQDGSVVYLWDMDGSGVMGYSETKTGNEE